MIFMKPKSRLHRVYNLRRGPRVVIPRPTTRAHIRYMACPTMVLPATCDLSARFPPPYDQGQWGTCYANAAAGIVQFLSKCPAVPSRLQIAWNACVKEGEPSVKEENGIASLVDTIAPLATLGYALESMSVAPWPYVPAYIDIQPPDAVNRDAMTRIIDSYASVNQDLTTIKGVLSGGSPVLFGFQVYPQFESDQCLRDGVVAYPNWYTRNMTRSLGGHAVVLTGYDDTKQCFKVRNSWGPDVQDRGHFWLPYQYTIDPTLCYDFWVLNK